MTKLELYKEVYKINPPQKYLQKTLCDLSGYEGLDYQLQFHELYKYLFWWKKNNIRAAILKTINDLSKIET